MTWPAKRKRICHLYAYINACSSMQIQVNTIRTNSIR